jgi:hypothetical protein
MLEILGKYLAKKFDRCVIELPKEFALANVFSEKCFVGLTLRNRKLESHIIEYTSQDEIEVADFIKDFPGLNKHSSELD